MATNGVGKAQEQDYVGSPEEVQCSSALALGSRSKSRSTPRIKDLFALG